MRSRPVAFLPAVALAVAFLIEAPRAQACWDGYQAIVGKATLDFPFDGKSPDQWSLPTIRAAALWGSRIDALLPPGTHLEAHSTTLFFCKAPPGGYCDENAEKLSGSDDNAPWSDDELPILFGNTTTLTHAGPAEIRRAMALTVVPLTVQVFAGKSERRARAVAASINDVEAGDHGFLEAGGFPATNPTAHVVDGKDDAGNPIHRVFVGAFLSRAAATSASATMHKTLGIKGFVRLL